jgi:hypothetical protein
VPARNSSRRRAGLLTCVAGLALASVLSSTTLAAADDSRPQPGGDPGVTPVAPGVSLDRATREAGRATWGPEHMVTEFVGFDGKTYQRAPWTTDGLNGTKFFGEEFDTACGYGDRFEPGLRRFARLARLIERSGRDVVFTVAPNKSVVRSADLVGVRVPHGRCARIGMKKQTKALDRFEDRNYVPMRGKLATLAAQGEQVYWDIDSHWTTVGHTRLAYAFAKRLAPEVAAGQRYLVRGTRTITPDVASLIGQPDVKETAPRRRILTPVEVRTKRGSDDYHPVTKFTTDHSWRTTPARRTIRGHTAVIGDSFMYLALESIRPLFQRGRFLWIGDRSVPTIIDEIVRADTVVIEIVQRYMPDSVLTAKKTQRRIAAALRKAG